MNEYKKQDTAIISVISAAVFFLIIALFGRSVEAAGILKPVNGSQSQVYLVSHNVSVVINNGFAKTEVDQVFANSGDQDLEAIYSFPLPKNSSLSEVSLWINGQEVMGEVLEKQKAREVYEDQKAKGNETAIAEKDDYKTYDVSVYPVSAKSDTRVRLVYYQPLEIDLHIGRYVYPLQEGGVDEERLSFWSVDDKVSGAMSFEVVLKSAYPVKEVRLPGFMQQAVIEEVAQEESGNGQVIRASLQFPEGGALDRDIIFYYRLDDSTPARVELVPYKEAGEKEGSFMLVVTPGVSLKNITEGIDWTFVLDKSGSMSGAKIETLNRGMAKVIGGLSVNDRFRIVTFNNQAEDITSGFLPATPENVNRAASLVQSIVAGGGTAMHEGLSMGLKRLEEERTQALILVTDGVANVGPSQHADFMKLLENYDVRLFTIVIGNSGNTPLLDRIARESGGFNMSISPQDDIYGRILQAKNKVLQEALHDVEVKFSKGKADSLTPASPGTLYRGQQLVMFGKYQSGPVEITLRAKISGQQYEWKCSTVFPDVDEENPEIERLWALSAIESIMDEINLHGESERLKSRIVDLGTAYSLVTDYTSMVVIDDQAAEEYGIERKNQKRVEKERVAQQQRKASTPASKRVDNSNDGGAFKNTPAPGIGTGPVGPLAVILIGLGSLVARRRRS